MEQKAPGKRFRATEEWAAVRGLLLLVALIAPFWIAVHLHLKEVDRNADEAVQFEADNLARSIEQSMARTIESADLLLRVVQASHMHDPDGFDVVELAKMAGMPSGFAIQLSIINAAGTVRLSSSDLGPQSINLSDRNYFRAQRDSPGDTLFISAPISGRYTGRTRIHFTRSLRGSDGIFDGVAVVSIDQAYLGRSLNLLRLGEDVLALIGQDGIERVRAPATGGPWSDFDATGMDRLLQSDAGSHRVRSRRDGIERLFSYRALEQYPMVAVAGIDLQRALSNGRLTRWRTLTGATISSLLVLVFGLQTLKHRRRLAGTSRALEGTLERMTQGVVMAAPNGRVLLLNDRARDLLELPVDSIGPGTPVVDLLARLGRPQPDTAEHPELLERKTADGRSVETEVLPLPEGGIVLTSTDVTAHRLAAAAQEAARASAEAANRAKSDFLATMSHEIRTPMNGVIGMIQVLRQSGLTGTQRAVCETITRSAQALMAVLNDILDYSKLEAGRISLEPLPCNVALLIEDVARLMRGSAEEKGVILRVEHLAAPPTVLIDPTRLRQILLNLLSNAVKFSDIGTITVRIDSEPDPADPTRALLLIAVEDQGIGIAPDALDRLFARFTQADASSTRRFGGSGLGLSISRELARLMNGDIAVRSRLNEGSEFTLHLSAPITTEAPVTGAEEEFEDIPTGTPEPLDILVAEDDEVNRTVIAAILKPDGHRVTFAYNGVDAVLAVRRAPFDIILMDVMMPGMDGPTATRTIRDLPGPAAATPIVALTANAMSGDRERYLAAGMNAYVSKPINRMELFRTIEKLLGVHAFSRHPPPPPAPAPAAAVPSAETARVHAELDNLLGGLDGLPGQDRPPA